jgi:hypothetical protein
LAASEGSDLEQELAMLLLATQPGLPLRSNNANFAATGPVMAAKKVAKKPVPKRVVKKAAPKKVAPKSQARRSERLEPLPSATLMDGNKNAQGGGALLAVGLSGAAAWATKGNSIMPSALGAVLAGLGVPVLFLVLLFLRSERDGTDTTFRFSDAQGGKLFEE